MRAAVVDLGLDYDKFRLVRKMAFAKALILPRLNSPIDLASPPPQVREMVMLKYGPGQPLTQEVMAEAELSLSGWLAEQKRRRHANEATSMEKMAQDYLNPDEGPGSSSAKKGKLSFTWP